MENENILGRGNSLVKDIQRRNSKFVDPWAGLYECQK